MNRTKTAIIDALWKLLEEKPYNKITVKDIVDLCQINRNTFYYHFHDIPELLALVLQTDAEHIISTYNNLSSPIDCLTPLILRCMERKKAILHLYHSVHREEFIRELDRIVLYAVDQCINTVTSDLLIPPDDKKLLIRFYKCMLIGILLDWLNEGMEYDLLASTTRICNLFDGSSRQAIFRASKASEINF